jgi:hypothetical protein
MAVKTSISRSKIMVFLITASVLISSLQGGSAVQAEVAGTADTACRIGIDAPLEVDGFDVASLQVASLMDWGAVNNPSLPAGVEYIRVLRLRDDMYPQTLSSLPAWVNANPAGVWIVGNEPDTTYEGQDGLLPEVYADRYYALATIIRQLDRTAQIGFGPIVQPTPIRLRYLQRAWERLAVDAGSTLAASKLVDIWVPHAFILNEQVGSWGTGVPPGFTNDHADAFIIDLAHLYYTYSIDIFQQRIISLRTWMASIGERDKPLWITEYGSLLPPVDPPAMDYYNVSDDDTSAYMLNTFEFMLDASDAQTGMPEDHNQLVQRWYWYSLNDHRYHFGGSLYNPDYPEYGPLITKVGQDFIDFQSENLIPPDLLPQSLAIGPVSYNQDHTRVDYRLEIVIDNNLFYDASCAQLTVYDGDPDSGGSLILGPFPASAIKADYGTGKAIVYWTDVQPLSEHKLCIAVAPIGVEDLVPDNNMSCYDVYLELPHMAFFPAVYR